MGGLQGIGGAILAIGIMVWVVARQVGERRVNWRLMVLIPAALGYFGWQMVPGGRIPAGHALELVVELVLAAACGVWQGATVKVRVRQGLWYMRGGWRYLIGWGAFLGGDIALHLLMEGPDAFAGAPAHGSMWVSALGAAAVWATRALVIAIRHPQTLALPGEAAAQRS